MNLKEIYRPIEKEITDVERFLDRSLKATRNDFILELNKFLLESPGKRIRPAMVILSAKASLGPKLSSAKDKEDQLIKIAAAIELIHIASLVHDDVIDYSCIRHNKPTINSKWGEDVAITLGDYLYSVAFEIIAACGNTDILQCISSAAKTMCEGELVQVCERDNLDLLKEQYFLIVKKKTASLFAASCQVGALICNSPNIFQETLKEYGLNFGISFQIIDDYLDLIGKESDLGKTPGQDIDSGEITLPVLYALESSPQDEMEKMRQLLFSKSDKDAFLKIRSVLPQSNAKNKTKETALSYMDTAKKRLEALPSSSYKESLLNLTDFIIKRGFNAGS